MLLRDPRLFDKMLQQQRDAAHMAFLGGSRGDEDSCWERAGRRVKVCRGFVLCSGVGCAND